MKMCHACKIISSRFKDHDRFCDGCVSDAIAAQPISLHFLDRLRLATDELEERAKSTVPVRPYDFAHQEQVERAKFVEAIRCEQIANPYPNRYDTMYGFSPL